MTILNLIESSKLIDVLPQGLYLEEEVNLGGEVSFFIPVAVTQDIPDTFYPESKTNVLNKIDTIPDPVIQTSEYLYAKELFLSLIEKETKCFSKFSSRDEECKNCMVAESCSRIKNALTSKRSKKRSKKNEMENKAQKLGFSFKGLKAAKKVIFKNYAPLTCKHPISCVVTNKHISVGEDMCHVKYFGIVHPNIIDLLIEWKAL